MERSIITLTTDFGDQSYVAAMKGRILRATPEAMIVDISHSITPHNIHEGAYILWSTLPHFPKAIHVGVVDPGVGTERRCVVMECEMGVLVGPDNGLLWPAASRLGFIGAFECETNRFPDLKEVSKTFHGRDIFAPMAAGLAYGLKPKDVGPRVLDPVRLDLFETIHGGREFECAVLHKDHFGNLILNVIAEEFKEAFEPFESITFSFDGKSYSVPFVGTYGDTKPGTLLCTISSSGLLEISMSCGNASKELGIGTGDTIVMKVI